MLHETKQLVYLGALLQNISLFASNDNIPELSEQFTLFLTGVTVLNEPASRTPTSGASLDSASTQASIVISPNDSPYGIFEFSAGMPGSGRSFIPAASAAPSLELRESAGLVDIYVVRAQGTVGNATVEYTTSPGTAVGDGASPDYTPIAARLEFAAGQLFRTFQLRINDDATPEIGKYFTLNLTNPQGGKPAVPRWLPGRSIYGCRSLVYTTSLIHLHFFWEKHSCSVRISC